MSNLETLINNRLEKDPMLEIFSIEYQGQKVWVKRARKTGSNLFHHLVYKLTKNPLAKPVENKNPKEALKFESSKLKALYELDIAVPKVIHVTENYFVLEDCGPTIEYYIKKNLLDDTMHMLENIITELATLHNKNEFHGGSLLRNFTYKDEKIYFIDFEESFDEESDMKELQFRDLCLFLFSISKAKIEADYQSLLIKYIDLTNNKEVIQKFHELVSKVSFLIKLVENKTIWNNLGKDGKSVFRLLKELKNIPA